MRTALFVDFDNIAISFAELDETAARRFATQPGRWLAWFESGAHSLGDGEGSPEARRILVRRCYLNPVTFGRYRSDYTRAAFTVVDCPPLTQRGKTSADVYMVMDVLDALEHPTRFDEFIILSSDADFTPVLLRLRAFDRRTTIIATNVAAAAYKAACDNVVPYERFFEEALGIEPDSVAEAAREAPPDRGGSLLPWVAETLRAQVLATGPLSARDVTTAFTTFPEFRNSHWFGHHSLKALMRALLELDPALAIRGDLTAAWSLMLREAGAAAEPAGAPALDGDPGAADLADRIVAEVRQLLAGSPRPVPLATVAHQVNLKLGPLVRESQWAGHGTFKALLRARGAPDLALLDVQAGFVLDPTRHDPGRGGEPEPALDASLPRELAAFIRRVAGITGAPALAPDGYAGLFRAVVGAVAADGTGSLGQLSALVRERAEPGDARASREQVNFVLTGFRYHQVDLDGRDAADLAREWRRIVRDLCSNAQLELSPEESGLLDRWIVGDPAPGPDAAPESTATMEAG